MSKSALTCDRCLPQSVTFGYYWCICVLNTLPKASQRWFPQHQFFPTNWEDLQVLPFMLLLSIKFTGLFALMRLDVAQPKNTLRKAQYSQLSPYWHPFITNTPIIWTAVKSYEKYILKMFDWNKLPQLRTLANEDTNSRSPQCLVKVFYFLCIRNSFSQLYLSTGMWPLATPRELR